MIKEVKAPRSAWRILVGVLCILLCLWALLPPLINGIVNVGVYVPLGAGLWGVIWGFSRPSKQAKKGWRRVVTVILAVLVAAVGVLAVTITGFMAVAAVRKPGEGPATLVVLGAKINGDTPSLMLGQRLDAAVRYLNTHPDAPCVVSGGQGADEAYTEAYVMKQYLIGQGIAPERIYEESSSTDTRENIRFSLQLIREQGLPQRLAVVTQEFHQYRAAVLAEELGAAGVGAVTCASPPHLLLCYWVRECAAICRLWIIGY